MIHIVTDGSVDMPEDWADMYSIHILPLMVRFGEKTYYSGVDIHPGNFYDLVKQFGVIPKTSLPSIGEITSFYRSIAKKGEEILSIHISGKLSGTFSAVQMAAREVADEINVVPLDSLAGSAAIGFMCREARLMDNTGQSLQKIIRRLEEIRDNLVVVFTLDTLEFARMNGRIGIIQSLFGSFLRIKPIIVLRDGLLEMGGKVRTRSASIHHILDLVKARLGYTKADIAVVHAGDFSSAEVLAENARQLFNVNELIITDLAIPVAANLGPGAVGIVAIPLLKE